MVVVIVVVVVVVAGIIIAIFGLDRYRGGSRSGTATSAVQRTDEVFVDPASGQRMRVWYNSETGEREYRPE
ncbi:MAG: hypothetical protein ACRENY_00835 [Candidatus Dormibacteria bacterium]